MRIGIDAQIATARVRSGPYQHLRHVVDELHQLAPGRVTCLVQRMTSDGKGDDQPGGRFDLFGRVPFRTWSPPPRFYRLWLRFGLFSRFDVLWHDMWSHLPECDTAANVYLIPDLIPLGIDYGAKYRQDALEYYRRALTRGDAVIVWAEHTKRDIESRLGVDPAKVHVVPLAPADEFRPASEDAVRTVRQRLALGDAPYVLSVGTVEPKRNYPTLVRAFARFAHDTRDRFTTLVLAGAKWRGGDELDQHIRDAGMTDRVKCIGFADDLPALYTGAAAFVYPSLYEGFGLPPLEAMACGTPVLASDATSLPEVVGDAGLLFKPLDEAQLADQLGQVLGDPAVRQRMADAGRARAAQFTWRKTAEGYLRVFREAHARKRGIAR